MLNQRIFVKDKLLFHFITLIHLKHLHIDLLIQYNDYRSSIQIYHNKIIYFKVESKILPFLYLPILSHKS